MIHKKSTPLSRYECEVSVEHLKCQGLHSGRNVLHLHHYCLTRLLNKQDQVMHPPHHIYDYQIRHGNCALTKVHVNVEISLNNQPVKLVELNITWCLAWAAVLFMWSSCVLLENLPAALPLVAPDSILFAIHKSDEIRKKALRNIFLC